MIKTLWLRHETKPFEERTALTPSKAKELNSLGYNVVVESSPTRAFKDKEYELAGCQIVSAGSWKSAPEDATILGLKELEDENFPLIHRHIYFAHIFKGQEGSQKTLSRFKEGDGKLYDLEYLVDNKKKRIAAFGVWAGYVGAALGVELWARQRMNLPINEWKKIKPFKNKANLIAQLSILLRTVELLPKVVIIGANGRCGKGAQDLLKDLGISPRKWTSKDTANGGPFEELLDYDLLINAVLVKKKTAPFLNNDLIKNGSRRLSVISDISCDPNGPLNPLPIYKKCTTMEMPALTILKSPRLDITAIDHLPSLLPRESSEDFCNQLFPHLVRFLGGHIENSPWERSLTKFYQNVYSSEQMSEDFIQE